MTSGADFARWAPRHQASTEYRYILRSREGATLLRPDGRPYVYPSYMAALRGAAMIDDRAVVIQQETSHV